MEVERTEEFEKTQENYDVVETSWQQHYCHVDDGTVEEDEKYQEESYSCRVKECESAFFDFFFFLCELNDDGEGKSQEAGKNLGE